jgi:AcrR family transcriptional regulator
MPRNAEETRAEIIRAAEGLFAKRGVDAVSLREINREADQRNATALQYHFDDRRGLVRAILEKHEPGIDASRHAMLDKIEKDAEPDLYRLSTALVLPVAEKLSDRDGGRAYLRIAAQLISRQGLKVDPMALGASANSLNRWRAMVAPEMSVLAVDPLHSRFTARRIMFVELARRAESPRRRDDRLFASHLVDLVTAILGAPISARTRSLLEERARHIEGKRTAP